MSISRASSALQPLSKENFVSSQPMDTTMVVKRLVKSLSRANENLVACQAELASTLQSKGEIAGNVVEQSNMIAKLQRKLQDAEDRLKKRDSEVMRLSSELDKSHAHARALSYQLHQLRGHIRVLCRVRPLLLGEITAEEQTPSVVADSTGHVVSLGSNQSGQNRSKLVRQQNFEFDHVCGPNTTQSAMFHEVEDLALSVLDGYNACIFAYGQTGSGKTYTMEGVDGNVGVNQRALEALFRVMKSREKDMIFDVNVSMLEVYNEQLCDLLGDEITMSNDEIKSHKTPEKERLKIYSKDGEIFVKGLTMSKATDAKQVVELVKRGLQMRSSAATKVHDRSSRSHCVLKVSIVGTHKLTGTQYKGKLHLVDLAGSENVAASGVVGDQLRLREAQNINKSLSALGDVFLGLSNTSSSSFTPLNKANNSGNKKSMTPKAHVPYRNSKLTHLLADSLGGDSKTLMIACINPTAKCTSETLNSLVFANRVRSVCLGPATANKKMLQKQASLVERQ